MSLKHIKFATCLFSIETVFAGALVVVIYVNKLDMFYVFVFHFMESQSSLRPLNRDG